MMNQQPKPGDVVNVRFDGVVVEPEFMPDSWRWMDAWVEIVDGNDIHHLIWQSETPGESVITVINEEGYEQGAIYQDAEGRFWYRLSNGDYPWRGVVSGQNHPESEPTRPLVRLVPAWATIGVDDQ